MRCIGEGAVCALPLKFSRQSTLLSTSAMDKHRARSLGDCDHAGGIESDKKIPLATAAIPIIAMARIVQTPARKDNNALVEAWQQPDAPNAMVYH